MSYFEFRGRDRHELAARELARHPDYRILRRLPHPDEFWLTPTPARKSAMIVGIVDTETTGLDPERDKLIEIAVVKMTLDVKGLLANIGPPLIELEDPGIPLPTMIEEITGLSNEDLEGHRFNDAMIGHELDDVDVLVSHNAAFDRAFLTRRFPALGHPWACSARDIDWRSFGLEGRALGHLLAGAGHFHDAHRAGPDAWALACLLARRAGDRRPMLAHLIESAGRPTWRLFARQAPFEFRTTLKAGGYSWDPKAKAWWIEGDSERIDNESLFLRTLHPLIRPEVEQIDWFTRHAK